MLRFVGQRLLIMIPMLFLISVLSFLIIQLPPGDYVETYVNNLRRSGTSLDQSVIDAMKQRYALDKPKLVQYFIWIKNIVTAGDFGNSFAYNRPVGEMLKERVPRTMGITLAGILLAWLIAIPIGIYSAVRQYSVFDYIFTFLGFLGLALPAFLFAIVLVFLIYQKTGWAITGIFSATYENAPWSLAKLWDMTKNLAVPLLVLSTSGAAGLIRIMRATLLDELKKQYVITARSKGLREIRLLFKYPVRLAFNPLISTIGWILPAAVGGEIVVSQVLNLPTTGPILIFSIMNQDMYLAGGILLILSCLTLVGTLLSDILLAVVDPRIRYRETMSNVLDQQELSTEFRGHDEEAKEDLAYASQGKLIWHKFRKHKVAMGSVVVLVLLYIGAIFADFIAPYEKNYRIPDVQYSSPTRLRIFEPGKGLSRPFVFAMAKKLDAKTFTYKTIPDVSTKWYLTFFPKTKPYKLLGFIPLNHRLFGVNTGYISFFGTNKLGMDILSQTLYASRISLSIGLIGVAISFLLGVILGGISGFFGGTIDLVIQRIIEFVLCLPQIPLWIAFSAAIPNRWSGIQTFFAITIILSFVGWAGLARVVRGRLISMREEDYVMAARVAGTRDMAIIRRHLLPGFMSYLVVNITLAIPGMILGETTLSFLGIGILPPEVSWGSMLQDANNLTMIFSYPWYLIPCIFVVVAVLAFNFVGDGLRDAADPYSR